MEISPTPGAIYPTEPTGQVGMWRLVLLLEQSILQNLQVRLVYGDLYYCQSNLSYRTYRVGWYMQTCTILRAIYPIEPTGQVGIWRIVLLLEQSILQNLQVWFVYGDLYTPRAIYPTEPTGQVGIWRLVLLLVQSILENLQVSLVYGDLYTPRAIYPTEHTGQVG